MDAGIEIDIYPGTEIMRGDLHRSEHHFTDDHDHNSEVGMALVPQPSSNSDDPLVRTIPLTGRSLIRRAEIKISPELDPVMEMDRGGPPDLFHPDFGHLRPLCVAPDTRL